MMDNSFQRRRRRPATNASTGPEVADVELFRALGGTDEQLQTPPNQRPRMAADPRYVDPAGGAFDDDALLGVLNDKAAGREPRYLGSNEGPRPQADPRFVNPAGGAFDADGLTNALNDRAAGRTPRYLGPNEGSLMTALGGPMAAPSPSHVGGNLPSMATPIINTWYLTTFGRLPTPEEVLLHTDNGRRSKDVNFVRQSLDRAQLGLSRGRIA